MTTPMKDLKTNYILDQATQLFLERGIKDVSFKDIAQACELGERTVYRYFGSKQNLIQACTLRISQEVYHIFERTKAGGSGYERLKLFYQAFAEIFRLHPEFYVFLDHFDELLSSGALEASEEYQQELRAIRQLYEDALKRGREDLSIRCPEEETFYYATTHALMSLCRKLATQAVLIPDDRSVDALGEVQLMIDIILYRLQP